MAGSSPAMLFASMDFDSSPMIIVGDSADDAGYLYHDLTRLIGDDAVMYFPSSYKRDIKYGQLDGPSRILRTETLSRWMAADTLRYVVTYPEALAEKVASAKDVSGHTITLSTKVPVDLTATQQWLRDNGFKEVDYVYEPGQWAVRGSILDIFGYSNELPYRLDFFGDDIDSIRTFNIETQLSEQKLEEVSITSALDTESESGMSLFEFVGAKTLVALRDAAYTVSRIKAIAEEKFSTSAMIAEEGDSSAMTQVVNADRTAAALEAMRQIRFTAGDVPDKECTAKIDFQCSPQALYHKNFDLISDSFSRLISDGYTLYILSDSEKQIERLRSIFADRGDTDISFVPIIPTLHQGFCE